MRNKIVLTLLGLIGFSFADLQVGDTISYYLNIYRLIMERDTTPRPGVVRYVGDNFYLVSGDRVSVLKIVRRNHYFYPDSFAYIAGTRRTAGKDPQYFYYTTDLITWKQNRSLSGADVGVDQVITPTGDRVNTYDLDIYDIASNPAPNAVTSYSSIYVASRDGLFGLNQALATASWMAMPDTAVYSVVFHPDSFGPIGPGNMWAKEVLFIGTAKGVYHVTVDIFDFSYVEQLADYSRMGSLTDTVFAVAVDPNNAKILYAGTKDKIYKWDSLNADWQSILNITGKARRIKFFDSNNIVAMTEDGIWYTTDGGSTWNQSLSGEDVWDIEFAYGYYWAATQNGVWRSSSFGGPWEDASNGLEALTAVGSKLCYTIYYDSQEDVLLLGNDQGVWRWNTSESTWINISKGIGSLIPDAEVNTLAQVIENPFGNGKNLFDSLKTILQVTDEELWDIDEDPHIYIVLSGLIVSTNLQDPTLRPIYGYFDPYDEDPSKPYSNGKEIFIVDVGNFYTPEGEIDKPYLARFIGYLYNLYAIWSLDRNESPALRAGLAIDALHMTGFNVFGDTIGIVGGRAWGVTERVNVPLLSYTTAWLNSPIAREMDRERVGYFIEYLRERFGNQIFYDILRDKDRDYYDVLEYHLGERGYTLSEILCDWEIANLLDNTSIAGGKYGYPEIDNIFNYGDKDEFSQEIPDSALKHYVVSPSAVAYWRGNEDTVYHFDLQDNFGDTLYNLRLYRIIADSDTVVTQIEFDTLYEYVVVGNDTIEILKRARNVVHDTVTVDGGTVWYVLVNTSQSLDAYYSNSYESQPPSIYSTYILQNPVITHYLDFYVLSREYLYGDANTNVLPSVYIVPFTEGMSSTEFPLEYMGKGDSVYIFQASLSLSPEAEGDFVVYSYAQDLAGFTTQLYYDTISIRKITGAGLYAFLGGKVLLEIPENMDYHNLIMVSRAKGMDDEYTVGGIYSIGNSNIEFPGMVKLIFKSSLFENRKDISLYRYDGEKWVECESYIDPEKGEVIAYVDRLGIFAVKTGNPIPLPKVFRFSLSSPNLLPLSSRISFHFELPVKSSVSISIFDVSGRKVFSKDFGKLSPGIYNYELMPEEISKGVYILRFKAKSKNKEYTKTLRVILF